MTDHPDDHPRALRDPEIRRRRREMLGMPPMTPLVRLLTDLRAGGPVPDFDPLDGGSAAKILFLFEKPGPMTDPRRPGRPGSGFVSRHSDDPTAEATWRFMRHAELPRADTIIGNIVPWWNETISVTGSERRRGRAELPKLLAILPLLHTVVLVGRTAAFAGPSVAHVRVLHSAHPSPQVRAANRAMWDAIPAVWRQATEPR